MVWGEGEGAGPLNSVFMGVYPLEKLNSKPQMCLVILSALAGRVIYSRVHQVCVITKEMHSRGNH